MSSLIERQAAIETVRKAQSIGQAHRMLAQLPSAQPGWVPVTERLPEKDGKYYVTQLRYGVYDSKMTGAYVRETNHIWYSVRHKRWSVMANCKVVAWIEELPKPWEGDVND